MCWRATEQTFGRRLVAQNGREPVMPAELAKMLRSHDAAIDEILGEDGAADQCLRRLAVAPCPHKIPFQATQIREQPLIDSGLAIDVRCIQPELAGLHCETAGERVELTKPVRDRFEPADEVLDRIAACRSVGAEAVIEINPARRDHPQKRREPLVPDLAAPFPDYLIAGVLSVRLKYTVRAEEPAIPHRA